MTKRKWVVIGIIAAVTGTTGITFLRKRVHQEIDETLLIEDDFTDELFLDAEQPASIAS